MPGRIAYNKKIRSWGLFAEAILKRSTLVTVFEDEGIKKSELETVSNTENTARAADQTQKEMTLKLKQITPDIKKHVKEIKELFATLRLRAPNAAEDLEKAGDGDGAQALRAIEFSPKAPPRVPGAKEEEEEASAPTPGEATEEETEEEAREKRESQAQKALANAAIRLEEYLRAKTSAVDALKARKTPDTFMDDLKQKGTELIRLREERALALSARKAATRAEYKAVKEHMEARKIIEPTVSVLVTKNSDIDALAVEHLKRKPNFDNQQRKKKKKAANGKEETEAKKSA